MIREASIDLVRERVTKQVSDADTLEEIEAAKQVLREWMRVHPEEQGMRAGFEQLYTLQESIEEQEAERLQSQLELTRAVN